MGAIEIVQSLRRNGVKFAVEGDRILWRNSDGQMTAEVVECIRAEKLRVRDFLAHGETEPLPATRVVTTLPVRRATDTATEPLPGLIGVGRVRTGTGRVVSHDAWRRLSAWGRHGPNGRDWDGRPRSWARADGEDDLDGALRPLQGQHQNAAGGMRGGVRAKCLEQGRAGP